MHRDRYCDPWEQGSPEHRDNSLSVTPAGCFASPALAAIEREIAIEMAEDDGVISHEQAHRLLAA
jgi:hypothetical protein